MIRIFGRGGRDGASLSDNRGGPWGPGGDDDGGGEGGGPRNPWGQRRRKPPKGGGEREPGPFDEFLRRSRERFGGGFPRDGRPYWLYGLVAFLLLWLVFTSVWRIGPRERGVVTTFGYYSRTMGPGVGFSLPWPFGAVQVLNVDEIRAIAIPENGENLILTGDQNVIDLSYTVRWKIKNPVLYQFQMQSPDVTIREVAESTMRAAVARVSLDDAIGAGRGDIEQRVAQNMQQLLDDYGSGVEIQGVSIRGSAAPQAVNDAFLAVSAAQQTAQSAMNQARAYALQKTAAAQGAAAEFDKIYVEYRAAPEVTRRRMYYETMERILQHVDTTIVEAPGITPYLPLPEVQRRAAPQPQPQAEGAPAR
jgi:membrane protease subunit HflK